MRAAVSCRLALAALFASCAAFGGVVRSRVAGASECGDMSPRAGGRLVLPAFDGGKVVLTLGARADSVTGHASYCGKSEGSSVRNATVVETPSGFVATVADAPSGGACVFRWNGESLRIVERAPSPSAARRRCAVKSAAGPAAKSSATGLSKAARSSSLTGSPLVDGKAMLSGETLTNVVDVLFAFDSSGASWVRTASSFAGEKNAVGLFAEDRVAHMNNILANSGLADRFSFRLAGTIAVATDARTVRSSDGTADLDAITDYLAGQRTDSNSARAADWKRVRSRRKAVGADLVTFLVKGAEYGVVGIGFSLNDSSIRDANFPDVAYNACAITTAAYDGTIAHECGHNMGAGHATMSDAYNSGPQLYNYSTGHYFNVTNSEGVVIDHCMTVMGYNDDGRSSSHAAAWRTYAQSHYVTVGGRRMRLVDSPYYDDNWAYGLHRETAYFSSPAVRCLYDDPVSGRTVASGVPTGTSLHDNARLLGLTYPLVANYRMHRDALLVSCSGHGSVEGGGMYAPGKKVKLSATPAAGYVFCGWYADARMKKPLPGLWQSESYTYALPPGGATVYAKFRAATSETARGLKVEPDCEFYALDPGTAQTIDLNVSAGCMPTVRASGLPPGMSLRRLADGRWVLSGMPTELGEWTVAVTASTAARPDGVRATVDILVGEWSGPAHVDVSPRLKTGAGAYVTLQAGSTNVATLGVRQRVVLSCSELSGEADPYVVTGLPPGLSHAAGVISGVPAKCGVFRVRAVTRKWWKWDGETEFVLRVRPLPAWGKGRFAGSVICTKSPGSLARRRGAAKLTVGATGAISGRLKLNKGGTATFAFASYTAQTDGSLTARGTAKVVKGGRTCRFSMTLTVLPGEDAEPGVAMIDMDGSDGDAAEKFGWDTAQAGLSQTRWTGADAALAAALDGRSLTVYTKKSGSPAGYRYRLALTFGSKGLANVEYRARDVSSGKWLPGTYSTSGTVILAVSADDGFVARVPLLLKKPGAEYAEVEFALSHRGRVSSPSATVPGR